MPEVAGHASGGVGQVCDGGAAVKMQCGGLGWENGWQILCLLPSSIIVRH